MSCVRVCKDCGRVRTLWIQLAAGSNAMHEVSHELLFTANLIRLGGETIEAVWLNTARFGLGLPCFNHGGSWDL